MNNNFENYVIKNIDNGDFHTILGVVYENGTAFVTFDNNGINNNAKFNEEDFKAILDGSKLAGDLKNILPEDDNGANYSYVLATKNNASDQESSQESSQDSSQESSSENNASDQESSQESSSENNVSDKDLTINVIKENADGSLECTFTNIKSGKNETFLLTAEGGDTQWIDLINKLK